MGSVKLANVPAVGVERLDLHEKKRLASVSQPAKLCRGEPRTPTAIRGRAGPARAKTARSGLAVEVGAHDRLAGVVDVDASAEGPTLPGEVEGL